jgi:prepilin-type N-terminal cleavage/methylation domain-containing protein
MKHQDGFTLIEVLVSFVILSGAIILSFESYSGGLRRLHQAQDAFEAQGLAQSVLARVLGGDPNLNDGETGKVGPFEWQLTLRAVAPDKSSVLQPVVVTVHIIDRQGKDIPSATLSTIKLQKTVTP